MQLVNLTGGGIGLLSAGMVISVERLGTLYAQRRPRHEPPALPTSVTGVVQAGSTARSALHALLDFYLEWDAAGERHDGLAVPIAQASLDLPIRDPGKIICVGRNYLTHTGETGRSAGAVPTVFLRLISSLVASGKPLTRPRASDEFDWEGEMAVVIGRPARRVPVAEAVTAVAGYSIFNDGSIRDYQRQGGQWTAGKNFPGSGSFGPCLTLAESVPDPQDLRLRTTVNEQVMQEASTGEMIFSVAEIVSFVSEFTELTAGDVIATGTPGGVGAFRDPPQFLIPGDRVAVEIAGLGTLVNPVTAERV